MDRRDSLRTIVGAALLPALYSLTPRRLFALSEFRVLDPKQAATVKAAAECIIPATETPGAGEAFIPEFVDVMLTEWYTPAERARLVAGLDGLTAQGFAGKSREEQTAILLPLDTGPVDVHAEQWFGMFKFLTLWGYYTSETGQTRELGQWPLPGHYEPCAPYRA